MPLYEYQCEACGHRFEMIRKFSDAPVEVCPVCGGKVHKQISSPAFQFKGTGWYVTDYAKKDSGASKDKDAKESAKDSKDSKESSTPAKDTAKTDSSSSSSGSSDSSSTSSASKPAAKE